MDKYEPAKPPGAQEEHSVGVKDLRTIPKPRIIDATVLDWFSTPDWTHPALGESVQPLFSQLIEQWPYSLGHAR